MTMRRDELQLRTGGTDGSDGPDGFVCVPDELVVRADVGEDVETWSADDLRRMRTGRRTIGEYEIWTVPGDGDGGDVVELADRIRRAAAGRPAGRRPALPGRRAPLATPHFAFGASGRVPMGAFAVMATNGRLQPLEAADRTFSVAVLDTGIVRGHPWFGDRVRALDGEDADEALPAERFGLLKPSTAHGTMVAGIVLGEAPRADVIAVRTMPDGYVTDEEVATAIRKVAGSHDVRIVNLSFGGRVGDFEAPALIEEALAELDDEVVVVAAAGNGGVAADVWPGTSPRVIAVGAVEEHPDLAPAPFSNVGPSVDVYAPGVSLVAPFCTFRETSTTTHEPCRPAQRFDGWARATGTSFAAAVVTGRIAQLAIATGRSPKEAACELLATTTRISVGGEERPFVASTAKIVL
jgi:hypothetical protein